MAWILLAAGTACLVLSATLLRKSGGNGLLRFGRAFLRVLALVVGLILVIAGGIMVWYTNRPMPPETEEILFDGVTYTRKIRSEPRKLIVHVAQIDLNTPGLRFVVTPGELEGEYPLRARTVSQFVRDFDVQIAVNGDFFTPFRSLSLFDYYPRAGDPVDVFGLASADGDVYSQANPNHPTVYFSEDGAISFDPPDEIFTAISGNTLLLRNGEIYAATDDPYLATFHPRTALALDESGETLILMVVDGRQPNYSEGVTLNELAQIVLDYGGYDAVNLDGGGSSALVIEGADGQPRILNSPIDNRIPGRERVVGNHLGVVVGQVE